GFGARAAECDGVGVAINQSGQQGAVTQIDHLGVRRWRRAKGRPGVGDAAVLHLDTRSAEWRVPVPVDQSGRLQDALHWRSPGSRASRSPSPSRLEPMTTIVIARPGAVVTCGAVNM